MTYEDLLRFLSDRKEAEMRLELGPTQAMLEHLGRPDRELTSILVAGTNGKGSACAFLASMARAAGLRVGTYTSPHIESVTERIAIGSEPIRPERLARVAGKLRDRLPPDLLRAVTYFEFLTLAAVVAFREARVELAVFEAGLGGRLDATNALDRVCAVVTSIDLDHTQILGSTLPAIAAEKAAIFRPNLPAVVAAQPPEALRTLRDAAREAKARLVLAGQTFSGDGDETAFSFRGMRRSVGPVPLGLRGEHQAENAAAAVAALLSLKPRPKIPDGALREGLAQADLPGRLERWVGADREVWLDIGHNPEAARAVARYFARVRKQPVDFLVGVLKDKDWRTILLNLLPIARSLILTRPDSPRSWDPAEALSWIGARVSARAIDCPREALEESLARSAYLVCTGSTFTVAALRPHLKEKGFERSIGR